MKSEQRKIEDMIGFFNSKSCVHANIKTVKLMIESLFRDVLTNKQLEEAFEIINRASEQFERKTE